MGIGTWCKGELLDKTAIHLAKGKIKRIKFWIFKEPDFIFRLRLTVVLEKIAGYRD